MRFKHTSCIFHETLIFNTTHTHTHTHTHTPAYIRHCSTRQGFSPSSSPIHLREYNSSTLYQCQVASRAFPAGVFRALKSSSGGGLEPAATLWTQMHYSYPEGPGPTSPALVMPDSKSMGLTVLRAG